MAKRKAEQVDFVGDTGLEGRYFKVVAAWIAQNGAVVSRSFGYLAADLEGARSVAIEDLRSKLGETVRIRSVAPWS